MIGALVLDLLSAWVLVTLLYCVVLNAIYLWMTIHAFIAMRRHSLRSRAVDAGNILSAEGLPGITLVVPAYNEEATCVDSVQALLTLEYPEVEILVVNDGSRDSTVSRLRDAYQMESCARGSMSDLPTAAIRGVYRSRRQQNLWLIDKENGGKSDALNAGVKYCRTPLFCCMDADTLLERDSLLRVVRPFLEDESTVAAGAVLRIANDCVLRTGVLTEVRLPRSWLARFQVVEYLRGFLAGRIGWSDLGATLIISGAFGLFRRSTVLEVGGFATDTVGEDMELVVRLHRFLRGQKRRYRMEFIPDPVAWTECPVGWGVLGRQRDRWQRGLMDTLLRHLAMLCRPRYGAIGCLAFPYFLLFEMLGAVVETLGYGVTALAALFGLISLPFAIAFFVSAILLGSLFSVAAVGLEELSYRRYRSWRDLLALLAVAVLENFGYRQWITYCRLRGTLSYLGGNKRWGTMVRSGFRTESRPQETKPDGSHHDPGAGGVARSG